MFNFFGFRRTKYNRNLVYNLVEYNKIKEMMLNTNDNIIIDVRDLNEYNTVHILNAVNIPVSKIRFCENEFKNKRNIILYCSTGSRTKEAIRILNNMGYTNLNIWEYGSLANFPYKDMLKM